MSGDTGHGLAEYYEILANYILVDLHPPLTHRRCGTGFEPRIMDQSLIERVREDFMIEMHSNNCANLGENQ
jgi:hypothetical protein